MGPDGTYLGDGVYATDDGWQVCLTVDRNGRKERIYLEPEVWAALQQYARDRMGWTDVGERRSP